MKIYKIFCLIILLFSLAFAVENTHNQQFNLKNPFYYGDYPELFSTDASFDYFQTISTNAKTFEGNSKDLTTGAKVCPGKINVNYGIDGTWALNSFYAFIPFDVQSLWTVYSNTKYNNNIYWMSESDFNYIKNLGDIGGSVESDDPISGVAGTVYNLLSSKLDYNEPIHSQQYLDYETFYAKGKANLFCRGNPLFSIYKDGVYQYSTSYSTFNGDSSYLFDAEAGTYTIKTEFGTIQCFGAAENFAKKDPNYSSSPVNTLAYFKQGSGSSFGISKITQTIEVTEELQAELSKVGLVKDSLGSTGPFEISPSTSGFSSTVALTFNVRNTGDLPVVIESVNILPSTFKVLLATAGISSAVGTVIDPGDSVVLNVLVQYTSDQPLQETTLAALIINGISTEKDCENKYPTTSLDVALAFRANQDDLNRPDTCSISPSSSTLDAGDSDSFSLTCLNEFGTEVSCGIFDWNLNGLTGTLTETNQNVDVTLSYTATGSGTLEAEITTDEDTFTCDSDITVISKTLSCIVFPETATISTDSVDQLFAGICYADSEVIGCGSISWNKGTLLADLTPMGSFVYLDPLSESTGTLTATVNTDGTIYTCNSNIIIEPPPETVYSCTVSPNDETIFATEDIDYTLNCFEDGNPISCGTKVNWVSVNLNGFFTSTTSTTSKFHADTESTGKIGAQVSLTRSFYCEADLEVLPEIIISDYTCELTPVTATTPVNNPQLFLLGCFDNGNPISCGNTIYWRNYDLDGSFITYNSKSGAKGAYFTPTELGLGRLEAIVRTAEPYSCDARIASYLDDDNCVITAPSSGKPGDSIAVTIDCTEDANSVLCHNVDWTAVGGQVLQSSDSGATIVLAGEGICDLAASIGSEYSCATVIAINPDSPESDVSCTIDSTLFPEGYGTVRYDAMCEEDGKEKKCNLYGTVKWDYDLQGQGATEAHSGNWLTLKFDNPLGGINLGSIVAEIDSTDGKIVCETELIIPSFICIDFM